MTRVKSVWVSCFVGMGLALLGACSPLVRQAPPAPLSRTMMSSAPQGAHDNQGEAVARHLTERYVDSKADCRRNANDPNPLPAILCSGVLMRATVRGNYYVWNPNPASSIKHGVSFSWLRKDSGFGGVVFGYTNGFIVLPHFYADNPSDGYTQLAVLCIYPFDSDTHNRTGGNNDGCGAHLATAGTGPCQAQGIQTAPQWLAKFANPANRYASQCGFTLTPSTANAYLAFQAQAVVRASLPQYFQLHNEIMLGTWAQNDRKLPIEAFFFTNAAGLSEAKLNQGDFEAMAGRWVPVIRIAMPTVNNGNATFSYSSADQAGP